MHEIYGMRRTEVLLCTRTLFILNNTPRRRGLTIKYTRYQVPRKWAEATASSVLVQYVMNTTAAVLLFFRGLRVSLSRAARLGCAHTAREHTRTSPGRTEVAQDIKCFSICAHDEYIPGAPQVGALQ